MYRLIGVATIRMVHWWCIGMMHDEPRPDRSLRHMMHHGGGKRGNHRPDRSPSIVLR